MQVRRGAGEIKHTGKDRDGDGNSRNDMVRVWGRLRVQLFLFAHRRDGNVFFLYNLLSFHAGVGRDWYCGRMGVSLKREVEDGDASGDEGPQKTNQENSSRGKQSRCLKIDIKIIFLVGLYNHPHSQTARRQLPNPTKTVARAQSTSYLLWSPSPLFNNYSSSFPALSQCPFSTSLHPFVPMFRFRWRRGKETTETTHVTDGWKSSHRTRSPDILSPYYNYSFPLFTFSFFTSLRRLAA